MDRKTRVVKVGNLKIGGNNPIIIQSMTNTNSADVEATVRQINELKKELIFLWLQIYILIIG